MHAVTGYVQVDNGRLYYEIAGGGDEAIVLIHGRAGDQRHWDAQFEALGRDYRVARYDVRGFGRSYRPDENFTYADHDELRQLLDGLQIDSAHIAGWSMGSMIAIDFVVANPSRAKSLIAIGPWVDGFTSRSADQFASEFAEFAAEIPGKDPELLAELWMKLPFFANAIRNRDAASRFRDIASDHSWSDMTLAGQRQPLNPGALARLHEISVPTLALTAEHDISACRDVADLLDARVPNSTKIVMPGTGHLMAMEKPMEFNRQVVEFLRAIGT